jgi:short subunit dehydrogenase-like uncharacterized protein
VRAAIDAGYHHADSCGEQSFIKEVFDTCAAAAERAGVTVVPTMTDGSAPGDLIVYLLSERLGPIDELVSAHLITATGEPPSRGSRFWVALEQRRMQRPTPQTDEGRAAERAIKTQLDSDDDRLTALFADVAAYARAPASGLLTCA